MVFIKTAEQIMEILSLSDRPIILVFLSSKGCCVNMSTLPPNGGAEYKEGSDLRRICGYISETVIYRGIGTMEDEYKVVYALSNSDAFNDLE